MIGLGAPAAALQVPPRAKLDSSVNPVAPASQEIVSPFADLATPRLGGAASAAQAQIAIGHLADYSGGTSDVGTPYGQAVADTFAWVNKNGGVGGKQLNVDTNDYGYQVPRAIALYKKWSGGDKVAAIMGWGTADTEALTGFLAQDKIPDISGSYAAALTDLTPAELDQAATDVTVTATTIKPVGGGNWTLTASAFSATGPPTLVCS